MRKVKDLLKLLEDGVIDQETELTTINDSGSKQTVTRLSYYEETQVHEPGQWQYLFPKKNVLLIT